MTEEKSIKALIVDDSDVIYQVIQRLPRRIPSIEVLTDASRLDEALKLAHVLQPDVILLSDYLLPADCAQASQYFRESGIAAPILIISTCMEPGVIARLFDNGANGVMDKNEMEGFLVQAIRLLYEGELYLSPKAAQALVRQDFEERYK